jgi:Clp amino terminal domain, pathogenicity island component
LRRNAHAHYNSTIMPTHSRYSHPARRSARLSELSRRVIRAAEQIAAAFHHPTLGLGHLLLALLLETRSPASILLQESGLDEIRLRNGLLERDPILLVNMDPILTQALISGSPYTGTEHLLLTFTLDPHGVILLTAYSVKIDDLRRRLTAESG